MVKMAFGARLDPLPKVRGVVLSVLFIRQWQGTTEMMVYWKMTSLRNGGHLPPRAP